MGRSARVIWGTRPHFGGCSPGELIHRSMRAAVSLRRALTSASCSLHDGGVLALSRACSASLIRRSSDGITCLNRLSRSRMRVPPRIPAARLNPRTYQWRQGSNRFLCHVCAKRWNKVVPPTPAAVLPKLPSLSASAARAFLHGSGREHRGFPESTSAVDNSKLANAGAAFHSELILPARGRCKATPFDSSAAPAASARRVNERSGPLEARRWRAATSTDCSLPTKLWSSPPGDPDPPS